MVLLRQLCPRRAGGLGDCPWLSQQALCSGIVCDCGIPLPLELSCPLCGRRYYTPAPFLASPASSRQDAMPPGLVAAALPLSGALEPGDGSRGGTALLPGQRVPDLPGRRTLEIR